MPDFSKRSNRKELLDDPSVPFEDIKKNMQELDTVNSLLGGHRITLKGFKKLLGDQKEISVCEIGCGGGDNLFAIKKWCNNNGVSITLTGIDINKNCVEFAKQQYPDFNFICSDYKKVRFTKKPDIIFNSLFCHHFLTEDVIEILKWMKHNSSRGFFVNDLHRHPFAHYSIKWITRLFSKSYLVKNDAPLSVLRGFTKNEWKEVLRLAGIESKVSWEWAFRYLVLFSHKATKDTTATAA